MSDDRGPLHLERVFCVDGEGRDGYAGDAPLHLFAGDGQDGGGPAAAVGVVRGELQLLGGTLAHYMSKVWTPFFLGGGDSKPQPGRGIGVTI